MLHRPKFQQLFAALLLVFSTAVLNAQYHLPDICAERRELVMYKAGVGVFIIPGILRTPYGHNDVSSSKYFYYLTGWEAPGAWIVIEPGAKARTSLFITPTDPSRQAWNNREPGLAEAVKVFRADTAYPLSAFR